MSTSLSFVLPAYNEAENIEAAVKQASRALAALVSAGLLVDWEVVVVDDGSSDGTAEVVSALYDPSVRLVQHSVNRGYGARCVQALRPRRWTSSSSPTRTFSSTRWRLIVCFHGLSATTLSRATVVPDRIPGFVEPTRRPGVWRSTVPSVLNVEDVNCAFKLFRRGVLDGLPIDSGWSLCECGDTPAREEARVHDQAGTCFTLRASRRSPDRGAAQGRSSRVSRAGALLSVHRISPARRHSASEVGGYSGPRSSS